MHEEEVLGKAYDGRLMRRLLRYMIPYRKVTALAFFCILVSSLLQVIPPYLLKVDVDRYLDSIEKLRRLRPRVLFYPHEGGVRVPGDIISRVAENTVLLRDIILDGLRNGRSTGDIEEAIEERLSGGTGSGEDAMGMETIIVGYGAYFRKKGLI